ncbi:uncharacterized protein LOC108625096 [Ceratina calcarata]|uniref:Uncharacterized protein LOC108625096 n=1 Tax=Ceratina calcarata TaxID=156304 RepID=A0AAJ7N780_9HYME|nr:uncharacterized protein LOC108625096 [Ceratina calcarata]
MEGRSVGLLKRKRNRLALDQAGVHKFTILTVTPAKNIRPMRIPIEVEISEEDFKVDPKEGTEEHTDNVGTTAHLNDSTFIEDVPSQREENNSSFDDAGDEFILSANLNGYEGMEVVVSDELAKILDDGSSLKRGTSTPAKPNTTMANGLAHEKEKTTTKQDTKEGSMTNKENEVDLDESLLRISLPLEEPTENVSSTLRLYNKKEGTKSGNAGTQGKTKHDRSHRKQTHRNGNVTSGGTIEA